MVTTVLSFIGMVFFAGMFCIGMVLGIIFRNRMNVQTGAMIHASLMCAVLCAYLGGW